MTIDVGTKDSELASRLSNFTARTFVFDGVPCCSIEGLIQSLKFPDPERQREICLLEGFRAKRKGKKRKWYLTKMLYWQGKEISRHSEEYQALITRIYDVVSCLPCFREDLLKTGQHKLVHSIGLPDPNYTVLTEEEFCGQLTRIRERYHAQEF